MRGGRQEPQRKARPSLSNRVYTSSPIASDAYHGSPQEGRVKLATGQRSRERSSLLIA